MKKVKTIILAALFCLALSSLQIANAAKDAINPEITKYINSMTDFYQKLTTCTPATYNQGDSSWKIIGIKGGKCRYGTYYNGKMYQECLLPLSFAKTYGTKKVNELKNNQIRINSNDGFSDYCRNIPQN